MGLLPEGLVRYLKGLLTVLVLAAGLSAAGEVITIDNATDRIYSSVRRFFVPYEATDVGPAGLRGVRLYYITDEGAEWTLYGERSEPTGSFEFVAPADGTYGFLVQAIDNVGHTESKEGLLTGTNHEITVVVDTKPPQILPVFPRQGGQLFPGAHMSIRFRAQDPNLLPASAAIRVRKDDEREFTELPSVIETDDGFLAHGDILFEGVYTVELAVADRAGNQTTKVFTFECTKTPKPLKRDPGPIGSAWTISIDSPPTPRSLSFNIDYTVADIGGQSPAAVGLWYTSDYGATWQFYGLDSDVASPFYFQAPKEGVYGFKLTSTTRSGISEPRPRAGTKPDILTLVDMTYPTLMLEDPRGGESYAGGQVHHIRWTARDDHFGSLPISIYVSREGGAWELLASELPNNNIYAWNVPLIEYAPYRLKLVARDQVGNTSNMISDTFHIVSAAPETRISGIFPSVSAIKVSSRQPPAAEPIVAKASPTPPPTGVSEVEIDRLIEKATAMRLRGDYEVAREALAEAVERDRHSVKARNELGALLTEMGRQEEAVEILKRARELAPSHRDVLYNLAAAYYLLGEYDDCAAALVTLSEMDPKDEPALWSLAKAYYKAQDIARARNTWKRLVALNVRGSAYAARARQALKTVREPSTE